MLLIYLLFTHTPYIIFYYIILYYRLQIFNYFSSNSSFLSPGPEKSTSNRSYFGLVKIAKGRMKGKKIYQFFRI